MKPHPKILRLSTRKRNGAWGPMRIDFRDTNPPIISAKIWFTYSQYISLGLDTLYLVKLIKFYQFLNFSKKHLIFKINILKANENN